MNRKIYFAIVGTFFALCLTFMFAVHYSVRVLNEYRIEYEALESEQNSFADMINTSEEQSRILEEIAGLDINHTGTASDSLSFYSQVRLAIENSGMNLLSMSSGQNEKDLKFSLKLQGNYYAFANLLAAWRNMPSASRIVSLKFRRDRDLPEDFIEADVTIEGMILSE